MFDMNVQWRYYKIAHRDGRLIGEFYADTVSAALMSAKWLSGVPYKDLVCEEVKDDQG